ncbi:molybdopterin synthase catalytic subunit-like isoform X1 [Bufo bufo]|uniref:molybdopterin synthase catalytic subunit-like isoform X1 n=2 Tax=Bufo bufo TaxID=8384 RepID=UPI001ABEC105|nr:molybdopterin synthase catalytic subunit-like isoform X1 [Bufo bufo]
MMDAAMEEKNKEPYDFIRLCKEKLSTEEVMQLVVSPSCGAVSIFVGTTRNNFEGKKVVHLEYDAYVPMAEMEIKKILTDIRQKWPSIRNMAVSHRLGSVPVTEASVVIAISSPHREDSLDAVKYCINSLKATVPIWKKEVYEEEGASWKENKECFWRKEDDK